MNMGPDNSSKVGALITCTKPHRWPMPLPRSRYQRPPALGLEQHLERFSVGPGVALSEAMQNCGKCLFWRGFDVDVLLEVEGKVV